MTGKTVYNVYNQIDTPDDYNYKLLHVPPELMEHLESPDGGALRIKAPQSSASEMVLCSDDKTWKIRQMNHSNTVLLLNQKSGEKMKRIDEEEKAEDINHGERHLVGFSSHTYEYELTQHQAQLKVAGIPYYDGDSIFGDEKGLLTESELLENSPISEKEFYNQWYKMCGSMVNKVAVILTESFVNELLSALIKYILSNGIDYKSGNFAIDLGSVEVWMNGISPKFTPETIKTILNKFADVNEDNLYKINNLFVSRWFGIQTLRDTNSIPVTINEFLLKWKSMLPTFYNVPIDIIQLRGYYFSINTKHIQYLDPTKLDRSDLNVRIKEMFQHKREWDIEEFISYIQLFISPNKKADKVILKYAKKKRVGKNKFNVIPK